MSFDFEQRRSDSPLVEMLWRTQSEHASSFTSVAVSHWEMVVTTHQGKTNLVIRGPETKATLAHGPADAEFFGVRFKLGTFIPKLPLSKLANGVLVLPEATGRSVWLDGSAWQIPDYDDAATFVNWLERAGLVVHDPVVEAALSGRAELSSRSVQRRFLHATGLTQGTVRQIERAEQAKTLLEQGVAIADTVYLAGYADQPHLTRALKRLVGQTPAQLARASGSG